MPGAITQKNKLASTYKIFILVKGKYEIRRLYLLLLYFLNVDVLVECDERSILLLSSLSNSTLRGGCYLKK